MNNNRNEANHLGLPQSNHMKFIIALLLSYSMAFSEINESPSRFLYELPVLDGMEGEIVEQQRLRYGKDGSFEYVIILKTLRSQEGLNISAEKIFDFYGKHLVSKGFKVWSSNPRSNRKRHQAPDLVTKGSANIRSNGHISVIVPEEGNFVTFWVEQRRDFDFKDSDPLLDRISERVKRVSDSFGFSFNVLEPHRIEISDWPEYTSNECFVARIVSHIQYQPKVPGSLSDDGNYTFYYSIFPTAEHADQWRDRLLSNEKEKQIDSFPKALEFKAMSIGNIVVEYKQNWHDAQNVELEHALVDTLTELKKMTSRSKGI